MELLDLKTVDGLTVTIRQNYADAMTVTDIFANNDYVRFIKLPPNPVVVDVGGFVGDFSLYAVKRLGAQKVIVCEPSPRNWEILVRNIARNGYDSRIEPENKAVTDGRNVMMNVDAADEEQCMVSATITSDQALREVPGISLSELLKKHSVERVDLLKIDCEGGEFEILDSTPDELFDQIGNIVFEYHQIDDVWAKLRRTKERLALLGYTLATHGGLVYAWRQ